jgi:hypothetical protein
MRGIQVAKRRSLLGELVPAVIGISLALFVVLVLFGKPEWMQ